jgi:flavin reductase (DIM6/NTAB) family NADH-FMN oxidoreductase RutF
MGDTLKDLYRRSLASDRVDSEGNPRRDFIINLLSSSQGDVARLFSRPDLHPQPFTHSAVKYELDQSGLPILQGSLGALTCQVAGAYALGMDGLHVDSEARPSVDGESELFVARVLAVRQADETAPAGTPAVDLKPLVYHRKKYGTVGTTNS